MEKNFELKEKAYLFSRIYLYVSQIASGSIVQMGYWGFFNGLINGHVIEYGIPKHTMYS
jgi:hypothetical protein